MSEPLIVFRGHAIAGTDQPLLGRVEGLDGEPFEQADLDSITCAVTNARTGAAISSPTVEVADAIFDDLQTDDTWSVDTTGYNFRHVVPASAIPTAGVVYRVVYTFTTTGSYVAKAIYELTTISG